MVDRQADKFALEGHKRGLKGCVDACLTQEPSVFTPSILLMFLSRIISQFAVGSKPKMWMLSCAGFSSQSVLDRLATCEEESAPAEKNRHPKVEVPFTMSITPLIKRHQL